MHNIACEVRSVYKHYEAADDVFVDREEFIDWMKEALVRCKEKTVVLHLKGIGGIGKSSTDLRGRFPKDQKTLL